MEHSHPFRDWYMNHPSFIPDFLSAKFLSFVAFVDFLVSYFLKMGSSLKPVIVRFLFECSRHN